MPAEAASNNRAEVEVLECVGGEVSGTECKEFGIEVVVVAQTAIGSIRAGAGDGVCACAVEGIGVDRGLISARAPGRGESGAEGGRFGVSASEGKADGG